MIHTHPGISRAEIAEESGLSKAAVSAMVTDLVSRGWLVETPMSPSGAGRRRVGLHVNRKAGFALGLEIASDSCTVVLTDLAGQLVRSATSSFRAPSASGAVRKAAALARSAARSNHLLVGLGVSLPGWVDAAGETVLLPAPPAWAGEIPLAALLREHLEMEVPIALINTYHAGALGEHRSGAGQGIDDMLFVSAGERIGAGFVLAGELYVGSSGSAGELEHIAIDPAGPRCACGNAGCLTALAGGPAVVELTVKALRAHGREHLLTGDSLTLQAIVEAAAAGDLSALAAVRQAGEYLGLAVAGLVNTFNPRRVVIGGQLAESGDTLIAPLRQAVLRRASPMAYSTVEIVQGAWGPHVAAVGAAALAIDRYLLACA